MPLKNHSILDRLREPVLIILTGLALIFFIAPRSWIESIHAQEMQMLESEMGLQATELMQERAENWYRQAMVDTGAQEAIEKFFEKGDNPRDPFDDRGLGAWAQKRSEVLLLVMRYGFYRWGMLLLWLPLLVAAAVPVSLDAAFQRDIRKYRFSHTSGLINKKSLWILHSITMLVVLMPIMPVAVPPLAVPVVLLLGLMAWWVYWANMQKRL